MINWGTQYFTEKSVSSPRLSIELLICEAMGCRRIDLYCNYEKPFKEEELISLREFVKRRAKNEPVQHIIGKAEFLDFTVNVDSSTLIPRPETEQWVSEAIKTYLPTAPPRKILDIGTGSGIIAIAMKRAFPESEVLAIDISEKAIQVARENSIKLNVGEIVFEQMDIMQKVPDQKFDLIISNPPYIPNDEISELQTEVSQYEPDSALIGGESGLDFYYRYHEILPDLLLRGASFWFEIGYAQREAIAKIFERDFIIDFAKDYQGIDRVVKGFYSPR